MGGMRKERKMCLEKYQVFIDGKYVASETGDTKPTFDLASEETITVLIGNSK